MHNQGRKKTRGTSTQPDRGDVEDVEIGRAGLNGKIKKLLDKLKFVGTFKLLVSPENRDKYIFKLLVELGEPKRFEIKTEFEDTPERILPRLIEYFKK